jgi:hypothetical protein
MDVPNTGTNGSLSQTNTCSILTLAQSSEAKIDGTLCKRPISSPRDGISYKFQQMWWRASGAGTWS